MDQRVSISYSVEGNKILEASAEVVVPPTRGAHTRADPDVWPPYLAAREPTEFVLTTIQEAAPAGATIEKTVEVWADGADPETDDPIGLKTIKLPAPPTRTRTMERLEGEFDPAAEVTRLGRLMRKALGHQAEADA